MKYIISILIFFCITTFAAIFLLWPDGGTKPEDVAATINGYQLGKERILSSSKKKGYHNDQYQDLLNSAITRELLIQEAQRQKIDKEESFRQALKTYYEESLIKILMDRQYANPINQISDAEVAAFKELYGKTVEFSRLPVVDGKIRETDKADTTNTNAVLFDDLADSMKLILATLTPGEHAIRYDTGNEEYAIRLDNVKEAQEQSTHIPDDERIRQMLQAYEQQKQIDNWLNQLRESASITIHNG